MEPTVQNPAANGTQEPNQQQNPNPATNANQNPGTTPPAAAPATEKTYTQEQINTMMANEKRTARQALLKELGFEVKDDKSYKDTVKGIKATLDAGKTQAQLDAEAKTAAEAAKAEAESKAAKLEMKVAALSAGVKPECLDDVIVLAQAKVSETEPVEKVLEGFKEKYPAFFGEGSVSSGTGSSNNPPRKRITGTEGLGQRLAKANKPVAKSSYFKN